MPGDDGTADTVPSGGFVGTLGRNDDLRDSMEDVRDERDAMTERQWERWQSLALVRAAGWQADHTYESPESWGPSAYTSVNICGRQGVYEPPANPPCIPVFVSAWNPDDWGDGGSIPDVSGTCSEVPCAGSPVTDLRVENCNRYMTQMFQSAWCLLLENWDVVEWIFRISFRSTVCIENVLNLRTIGFHVACAKTSGPDPYTCAQNSAAHSYEWPVADIEGFGIAGEGWISVCMAGRSNQARLRAFASGSSVDILCAVIDLAAVILHELTHICLLNYDQDNDRCEYSYTTENTFRWAMFQRFPRAKKSKCCQKWFTDGLDNLFMAPQWWDTDMSVPSACA